MFHLSFQQRYIPITFLGVHIPGEVGTNIKNYEIAHRVDLTNERFPHRGRSPFLLRIEAAPTTGNRTRKIITDKMWQDLCTHRGAYEIAERNTLMNEILSRFEALEKSGHWQAIVEDPITGLQMALEKKLDDERLALAEPTLFSNSKQLYQSVSDDAKILWAAFKLAYQLTP